MPTTTNIIPGRLPPKKQQWYATPNDARAILGLLYVYKRVISCDVVCERVPMCRVFPSTQLLWHGGGFPLLFPTRDMKCTSPRLLQYYLELVDDV